MQRAWPAAAKDVCALQVLGPIVVAMVVVYIYIYICYQTQSFWMDIMNKQLKVERG